MVVHLLSVGFTGFIFWLAVPGSNLFSWHPICMATAFALLLLQAVVVFSPESSLFQSSARADKVTLHWILHAFGLASAAFGFGAVYLNKEINEKDHFTTWHGKMGLVTVLGSFGVALGGICAKYSQSFKKMVRPANMKMYHATGGMLIFCAAMATIALACYSAWFKNRVKGWVWRMVFWTPIVLAVCVARQVTQSYLPRVLTQRESELDAKARTVQEKVEAKLKRQEEKKRGKKEAEVETNSQAKEPQEVDKKED